MKTLCVALVISASTWAGPAEIIVGMDGVYGWTKDSRYFAWGSERISAWNARTGRVETFASIEALTKGRSPVEIEPAKWPASRTSPDGKSRAEVRLSREGKDGAWKGSVWTPPPASSAGFYVERDGKSWQSVAWTSGAYRVSPWWSPDGTRIAWLVKPDNRYGAGGMESFSVAIGPAGPRVQLLAHKALLTKATELVGEALEKAGFGLTQTGVAKKARDVSVVYVSKGAEALGAEVAKAVPGGASVDTLTWDAKADVVVAAGTSVLNLGAK